MPLSAGVFGDLGGAVSSIFGGIGEFASAKGYGQAADYARINAEIAQQTSDIQQTMTARKVYQTIGGQQADVAGAGLASSGSATDILRSSAEQGSLTKQLVAKQGAINVMGYQAEAASYDAMASAAKAAGGGGILGGIMKGVGAAVSLFSDDRLKTNPVLLERRRDGLGIWEFSYRGSTERFRGVMASEVERLYPAAIEWEDGYRKVNYGVLGVVPEQVV